MVILEGSLCPPWGLLGLVVCLRAPAPRVGDGPGSLACHSPWGRKKSDSTERLSPRTKSLGGQSGIIRFLQSQVGRGCDGCRQRILESEGPGRWRGR